MNQAASGSIKVMMSKLDPWPKSPVIVRLDLSDSDLDPSTAVVLKVESSMERQSHIMNINSNSNNNFSNVFFLLTPLLMSLRRKNTNINTNNIISNIFRLLTLLLMCLRWKIKNMNTNSSSNTINKVFRLLTPLLTNNKPADIDDGSWWCHWTTAAAGTSTFICRFIFRRHCH